MKTKKEQVLDNGIISGVIWQQLLLYFFPLLFGTFFQQLYNTVDAVIVGRFVSKEALAAVGGSSATLVNLYVGFFIGMSSGATVIIAQFYGAGRKEEVSRSVHTAIAMAIAGGVLFMLAGFITAPWAIHMMKTPTDTVAGSVLYLRIYFCGMIPNLVYNVGAGILRAVGDSKRPLYVLIISCFANIVLDMFFVLQMHMGIAGVAIATILCQMISALLVMGILMRSEDCYRLVLRKIRIDTDMLGKIIHIGLPSGIQSMMYTISNLLIQASINGFQTDAVSAWAAYGKIDSVYWMIISSLGISITTFVGQNYGAGRYARVRKSVRQCFGISVAFTVSLSTVLMLYGQYLYVLFTTDKSVMKIGTEMMHYLVPFYITYIGIEMFSGALRGMGDSIVPMALTIGGVCVLRVLWILTAVPVNHQITTVIASYPITWSITSILFFVYYEWFVRRHRIK
ncbi:MAG: MATE family efflux transporter [Butyrivibrio sp.]|jgi:putative MATE family efflux protein|nr:MATE family efflux transporter [Butyrivibrio sp.]